MGYFGSSLADDCSAGFRLNCSLFLFLLRGFNCWDCRVVIDCCRVRHLGEVIRIGLNACIEHLCPHSNTSSNTIKHVIVAADSDLGLVDGLAIFLAFCSMC